MEGNNLKILLVDDDGDDAEMIMYSLRKLAFVDIHYIDDGAVALRYLLDNNSEEPSLILLDLKMPKVDGVEILRILKGKADKRHIPVAALISSKSGVQYLESFGVKPEAYLSKPVTASEFLTVLAKVGLSTFSRQPLSGEQSANLLEGAV